MRMRSLMSLPSLCNVDEITDESPLSMQCGWDLWFVSPLYTIWMIPWSIMSLPSLCNVDEISDESPLSMQCIWDIAAISDESSLSIKCHLNIVDVFKHANVIRVRRWLSLEWPLIIEPDCCKHMAAVNMTCLSNPPNMVNALTLSIQLCSSWLQASAYSNIQPLWVQCLHGVANIYTKRQH